jgi:hypothetical protein
LTVTPGNSATTSFYPGMGADGLIFQTRANLVPEDESEDDPFAGAATDLYRVGGGTPELLSGGPPGATQGVYFGNAPSTPDLSTVMFSTSVGIDPVDTDGMQDVYISGPDGIELASVRTDGAPENEQFADATVPLWYVPVGRGGFPGSLGRLPLSEDGRWAVMDTTAQLTPADSDFSNDLYLWHDGEVTLISRSTGVPAELPAQFEGMAYDASSIYFTTEEQLLSADADGAQDIYRFEPDALPDDQLTLVSGTGSAPAYASTVARNGQLFFLSDDRLGNDPPPPGPEPVIYRSTGNGIETISSLAVQGATEGTDPDPFSAHFEDYPGFTSRISVAGVNAPNGRPVRANSDGSVLVFTTGAQLDDRDTDSAPDVYRWTAGDGVTLVSVGGGEEPAVLGGSVSLNNRGGLVNDAQGAGRVLAQDGQRLFFTHAGALTSDAPDNGEPKVYEWSLGGLALVTPADPGTTSARYVDSSESGDDVFFATSDELVSGDRDGGLQDIYDARVGGGFPPPAGSSVGADPNPGGGGQVPGKTIASKSPSIGGGTPIFGHLTLNGRTLRATRRRVPMSVRISVPARVWAALRDGKGRVLARGSKRLKRRGPAVLKLRLTKAGRRMAAQRQTIAGRLRVSMAPAGAAEAVTKSYRVTVRSMRSGQGGGR